MATNDRAAPAACIDPQLEPGWNAALSDAFARPEAAELTQFLLDERAAGNVILPPRRQVFAAFDRTPLDQVRVVIVGQDPYHGPGQAMGLSFSVPRGVPQPPSLRNMLAELQADLGIERPTHGDLSHWTDQGVLLLNTSLTVRSGEAGSHSGRGWEQLTDAAIRAVDEHRSGVAFLLWGRHAQAKQVLIDAQRHLLLQAPHPSPLSASRGFFGCRHFSKVNDWLVARGDQPIDWALPG